MTWWWHTHHWHRFETMLIRKSPDCAGEQEGHYRCCHCRKVHSGVPMRGRIGEPETDYAYIIHPEEALR